MEVHHHPEVEKKGFKEYLLEGLMIFIAVMMGFFAESLREHIADHDREKQSIESLVKAVSSDTVQLHTIILQTTQSAGAIDSLLDLKNHDLTQSEFKRRFYVYSINGFSNDSYFRSNNGALLQLSSSGTLRLISNRATVDSIFKYQQLNESIIAQEADNYLIFKEELSRMAKVEDLTIFHDTTIVRKHFDPSDGVRYTFSTDKLPAISTDKVLMKEYFNYASLSYGTDVTYDHLLEKQLDYARRLIIYLKKEYGLE